MSVTSKWMFLLIGDNETGKTTIQKALIELLNGGVYDRLPSNQAYDVTHPCFLKKCRRFFVGGRSYQELLTKDENTNKGENTYTSVEQYFERRIDPAVLPTIPAVPPNVDLGFIASHLDGIVIDEMIRHAHRRFWNVGGIFLTNSLAANPQVNAAISELPWDERWVAENAPSYDSGTQNRQLRRVAEAIVQLLIERTRGW